MFLKLSISGKYKIAVVLDRTILLIFFLFSLLGSFVGWYAATHGGDKILLSVAATLNYPLSGYIGCRIIFALIKSAMD